jgi:hypothetical protein
MTTAPMTTAPMTTATTTDDMGPHSVNTTPPITDAGTSHS